MKKIYLWAVLIGLYNSMFGVMHDSHYLHFAVELDYALMCRTNSYNKKLTIPANSQAAFISEIPIENRKKIETPSIESKNLLHSLGFGGGFSAALKIFPSISSTWEARYLGGLNWQAEKKSYCLQDIDIDIDEKFPINYHLASSIKAAYNSKLNTYELNYWHHITPKYINPFSISYIAGLLYIDIDEKLKVYFTRSINFLFQTNAYRVHVENRSFGLQIGGDLEYNPYPWLTWGLIVKTGALLNRDAQHTLMLDKRNTSTVQDFAYMVQLHPFIELHPIKHLLLLVTYQMFYVGGIATADRTLSFHDNTILDHNGHITYSGITGAIQFNF